MIISKELLEKFSTAKTAEELDSIVKSININLTKEQVNSFFDFLKNRKPGEIPDVILKKVNGGGNVLPPQCVLIKENVTCPFCHKNIDSQLYRVDFSGLENKVCMFNCNNCKRGFTALYQDGKIIFAE